MPSFMDWLTGKKAKIKKAKTVTPEQEQIMALIKEGLEKGSGPFADVFGGFKEEEFQKGVAQPTIKQFQEEILPMLQEKFIANNQVLGSGFQRAQGKAATDLQSQLAQLRYGAQQQKAEQRQRGLENLTGQRTFENIYQKPTSGFLSELTSGVAPEIAKGALTGGISNAFGNTQANPLRAAINLRT